MTHLRKMMLEELERRNYAQTTIDCYIQTIEDFARHFRRPPDQLTPEHIREYQAYLFRERKLAASTVTQRLAALRFFYTQTIKKAWSVAATPYPKKTRPLPSILSPEEVAQLIDSSQTRFHRMVLMTLYGTGVRRAELARLQIPDIDSGSAIAAGLPYLHQAMVALGHPHGLDVTLVDGDRISRTNCVRQPFSESEIGLHKATVLATRINLFWGLGWKGVPHFVDEGWGHETDILIGCVDSRAARNAMTRTQTYWNCHYWLDLGNNADSGQFVLGQPENQRNKARDLRLPTAPELFPELINARLDKKDRLPHCSALEALERQEPFVNQTLAYQALAMLARLFRYGRLQYHGGFVNLRIGRTTSLAVNPVLWQRMSTQPSYSELPRSKRRRVVRQ